MFGKKNRELAKKIEEQTKKIEELTAAVSEKQSLVDKSIDELNKAKNDIEAVKKELAAAKKTIAEFEARQEAISAAMTEATDMKERILKEAREEAERLEAEGRKRREEFITEGQLVCDKAQSGAEKLLEEARERARIDAERSQKDAENTVSEAESAARKLIEDARSASKGMLDEADEGVRARNAQLEELNELIKERARLALKDAEFYADTLDSVSKRSEALRPAPKKPQEKAADADKKPKAKKPAGTGGSPELQRSYKDAAALMRSIYSIEGRELPGEESEKSAADGADEEFSMPVDPDFADIISDILGNGKKTEN